MSKENGDLYFPHDFNAANDDKTVAFLSKYGSEGYGVYWLIVEHMHKNEGKYEKKKHNYRATAHRSLTTAERIQAILCDLIECELFYENDDAYYSERVIKNLEKSKKISEQNAQNARKRNTKPSDRSPLANDRRTTAHIQDKTKEEEIKEKEKDKKEIPAVPSGSMSFEEFSETFRDEFITEKDIVFPEWIEKATILKERLKFYIFKFRPKTNKKLKNTGTAITRIIKRLEDDCGKCPDIALANLEYSITKSYDMIYPEPARQQAISTTTVSKPFDIVEYAKENLEKLQANPTGPHSWKNTLISVLQKNCNDDITEFVDQNIENLKAITDIVEFAREIKTAVKHKEDT
jgi:uncharacterized protein YdaU (DUF1376 family)